MAELRFDSNLTTTSSFIVSPSSIPALPLLSLSDGEQQLIQTLQARAEHDRPELLMENAFYMGEQTIQNLRIALQDDLAAQLKTILGWARIAVDPYVERLSCDGFRLPGATDVDPHLAEIWDGNGLAAEQSLAYTDALSMRRAYWMVGRDPLGGDMPLVTAESPLNMSVLWDVTGRRVQAAMQTYKQDRQTRAVVMTPMQTVEIAQDEFKVWKVVNRDLHKFGEVPVRRMANKPRSYNRDGFSEVTPELRTIIINACRRSMGLEASSELYSVPRLWLLGASADDFTNPNGEARKQWDAFISKINIIEPDDEGNTPTVTQLMTYDPSVFTKVIEMYAAQAAGMLAALPQDLGLYTQGNPPSVESVDAMEKRRNLKAEQRQRQYGVAIVETMQLAMRFQNGGKLPAEFKRIEVDWKPVQNSINAGMADGLTKLIKGGVLPPTSDVTLKRAGFTAVERLQLEQDRGQQALDTIVQTLQAAPKQPAQAPVTDGNPAGG